MAKDNPDKIQLETDPRFPSGKWVGFWLQRIYAGRQHMSLLLTFAQGKVIGTGVDCVGDFALSGIYDLESGKVSILKSYDGAHQVEYDGQNDGDGLWIWGTWRIGAFDRGGFHLWPDGEEDPTQRRRRAQKSEPVKKPRGKLAPVGG